LQRCISRWVRVVTRHQQRLSDDLQTSEAENSTCFVRRLTVAYTSGINPAPPAPLKLQLSGAL